MIQLSDNLNSSYFKPKKYIENIVRDFLGESSNAF